MSVIWRVYEWMPGNFYAERVENGVVTKRDETLSSHCLQCAKTDVMAKTGEKVDIRGWHMAKCGPFTKAMAVGILLEEK